MQQKEIESLLKSRGIKITSKRLLLLDVIAKDNSAIARSKLQKELINFDRVTLYRTINTLIDGGIIHVAHISNEDVYYAMCKHHCSSEKHSHKHIHFKCTVCLDVKCVETTEEVVFNLPNFSVSEVNIEVTGVCDVCLK